MRSNSYKGQDHFKVKATLKDQCFTLFLGFVATYGQWAIASGARAFVWNKYGTCDCFF